MAIVKTLKLIKDEKGVVLLYNIQNNLLIASFEPSLNIVRERGDPNRFKISSSVSADGEGFVLDYRSIDAALCVPIIVEANSNEFLIELSRKFFFLNKKILITDVEGLENLLLEAKSYLEGDFHIFKRKGNKVRGKLEINDLVFGIVEDIFIKGIYLGDDITLLSSFDIYSRDVF